jgi:hypothetical protein
VVDAGEEDDDGDILQHLDIAFRREQTALRVRNYRARKKSRHEIEDWGTSLEFMKPLREEDKYKCMDLLQETLGAEGLDECSCLVCDRLVLRRDAVRKEAGDWRYVDMIKKCLGEVETDLPRELVEQYTAPPQLEGLENVLVSPRGIKCYFSEDGCPTAWMSVCKRCDASIMNKKLPKFAIANGVFVGRLPEYLRGLTIPERFMTQLASFGAITRVMRGGRHRCIRSHCVAFDCSPGPPVTLLPRSLVDVSSYRVVMVGDFTEGQTRKVRKMHRVRRQLVDDVFSFYKTSNTLYENVLPNDEVLNTDYTDISIDCDLFEHIDDDAGRYEDDMNIQQQNIRGQSEAWQVQSEQDEWVVLERRSNLVDGSLPIMAKDHPLVAQAGNDPHEREFLVRQSNNFFNDISVDCFARLFPHLCPFGHGHPGEHRRDHVSVTECVKYYISLSERQFAEDELFALVAFDRISMENMYIQNSVRCRRFPHMYNGYESIATDQLASALLANERRLQGSLPQGIPTDSTTDRFLKTVELTSGSLWGSNSERSRCRQKAFAYQTRFGQPALFVTLTPNTDNSLAMAHYTGISSVDSLFDVLDANQIGAA